MTRFKVGDHVSGETFDYGKVIEVDKRGNRVYYLCWPIGQGTREPVWVDDIHIDTPTEKRHDPRLDHYWDH